MTGSEYSITDYLILIDILYDDTISQAELSKLFFSVFVLLLLSPMRSSSFPLRQSLFCLLHPQLKQKSRLPLRCNHHNHKAPSTSTSFSAPSIGAAILVVAFLARDAFAALR